MAQLDALLEISGHSSAKGPSLSGTSVLAVLDSDIMTWPVEKLKQMHSLYDIHIIPEQGTKGLDFDIKSCEWLGLNIDQMRQVHGKL